MQFDQLKSLTSGKNVVVTAFIILLIGSFLAISGNPYNTLSADSIEDQPNVVLVTIESLPSYKLECYGYERETMPNLCDFAENATVYEDAYSEGYTALTIPAIETGKHPYRLGVTDQFSEIPLEEQTLAEVLQGAGYNTYSGRGYGNVPVYNEGQGYQSSLRHLNHDRHHITRVMEQNEDPVFVRMHLWDTHGHGDPSRVEDMSNIMSNFGIDYEYKFVDEIRERDGSGLEEQYEWDIKDEQSRAADKLRISRIIDEIRASGEYQNTLVIFTSDHGTLMNKIDGRGGHMHPSTSDNHLNVPLIIKYPSQDEGERKEGAVSLVDLYPTIVEETGIEFDREMDGVPIGEERLEPVLTTTRYSGVSAINDTHKLYHCSDREFEEGCGDNTDYVSYEKSGEEWALVSEDPENLQGLKEEIRQYFNDIDDLELNRDERVELENRLTELGYID